jgi:hypothetical protein
MSKILNHKVTDINFNFIMIIMLIKAAIVGAIPLIFLLLQQIMIVVLNNHPKEPITITVNKVFLLINLK